MRTGRIAACVALCTALLPASVRLSAQAPGTTGFLSGRLGVNAQVVPDGVSDMSLGAGGAVGVFVTRRWALEFEAWIPGEVESAGARNRVMLFSGSALRFLDAADRGLYLLAGLGVARVEWGSSSRLSSQLNGAVQAGAGVSLRLGGRLSVAPEVRAALVDGGAFIVRPSIALHYSFP